MIKKLLSFLLAGLLLVQSGGFLLAQSNGNNWFSQVLPSANRTSTTVVTVDQTNSLWRGAHFIVNITGASVTGSYTPHIQGKDPVSGNYYDILVGTALNTVGATVLKVYPGITASSNVAVSDILPRTWRLQLIGSTPNMTISVGALLQQ